MKQSQVISYHKIAAWLTVWLLAADIFVLVGWWPLKLLAFASISFLPGIAVLRLLKITPRNFSAGVLYSFGLSLLVLMISGLAANSALHLFGVSRPLELGGALCSWSLFTAIIIAAGARVNTGSVRLPVRWPRPKTKFSKQAFLLIISSALMPCLAALGAFRLNNGSDGLVAMLALGYATALVIYVFLARKHLPDGLLAWFIFVLGLTILLMTSLRGWDIVGHDIEREFRVYTQTHLLGLWDISLHRDPYNACLSITILPQMFSQLLGVSGLMVFKVILQVIFAACPAAVFVMLRQHVSKLGALVGGMLFICYPTFINDSAMLTRQGVAYLFFALALMIIADAERAKRYKLLFFLFSLGAILSHYSTAYMFVALFAGAYFCKLCLMARKSTRPAVLSQVHTVLSPLFVVVLFAMTFVWYTQITATSGGLVKTLASSFVSIPRIFTDDNKSSDISNALFFANKKTQADLYQSYLNGAHGDTVQNAPQYFPELASDNMPLTSLGKKAVSVGVNPSVISTLRQNFAKILQALALVSVLYAAFRLLRNKADALNPDLICLSLSGIVLLGLMVLLPVLSINYGVLRAFQQMLIFLVIPIAIFLVRASSRLPVSAARAAATTGVVLLFLLFTGVFAQLLGGVPPSLTMNNSGLYYGLYYSSLADRQSFLWLQENIPPKSDVRSANPNRAFMHNPDYPFSNAGLLPTQLWPHSVVYLDEAQFKTLRFYKYFDSSPLVMTFPKDYFDDYKDQVYSTGATGVYR